MNIGDKVYKIISTYFKKQIDVGVVTKVRKKTISIDFPNKSENVNMKFFDEHREGVIKDSFIQYTRTLEQADKISIMLMDLVLARKFEQSQEINKQLNAAVKVRNSAPTIVEERFEL